MFSKVTRMPTSEARDRLAAIITFIQDPRRTVILTRHGKDVGAIVSKEELARIWKSQDTDEIAIGFRPAMFTLGKGGGWNTASEAGEAIRQLQVDRLVEREVLRKAGLEPVPGGELIAEDMAVVEVADAPVSEPEGTRRRWWRFW